MKIRYHNSNSQISNKTLGRQPQKYNFIKITFQTIIKSMKKWTWVQTKQSLPSSSQIRQKLSQKDEYIQSIMEILSCSKFLFSIFVTSHSIVIQHIQLEIQIEIFKIFNRNFFQSPPLTNTTNFDFYIMPFNNKLQIQQTKMGCGAQSTTKDGEPTVITPEAFRRYTRKQLIGKGTYGEVYKCIDTVTNQIFAMKVIKLNSKTKQQAVKQIASLKSQISLLKKLNHPYIVKYQSFDVTPNLDQVQIVMELVKQGTLKQYIEKHGPLKQPLCAQIAAKILEALIYIHQQSIIHRDLKCANILINQNLQPKLSDFGTAKVIYQKDTDDIAKMSASLKGTPYYMAPQVIKRTGHNQFADIWSFGCLVIEMLSGKAPWIALGAKFSQIINYISSGVHPPFPPNITRECQFFLQSCLDPVPSKRLSAQQLIKHRFIQKYSIYSIKKNETSRKQRSRKASQNKGLSRQTILIDEIQNIDQQKDGQATIRKQGYLLGPSEKKYLAENESKKNTKRENKPFKKDTQKYISQINKLDMLQAEINQVSISSQEVSKDKYFVKKTLANLKSSKNGKNISKTSTTIKNSENNIANMSASQAVDPQDYQLRINTEGSKQQQFINTIISRAERNQYIQNQKIIQRQREDQKKKWQQQLKEGANMLKKELSSRYMITRV